MLSYLAYRFVQGILVLVGLSILIFFLSRLAPGDPVRLLLPEEAPASEIQRIRHELGLDRPLYIQYLLYMKGLSQGKLGLSFFTRRDVAEDLAERIPATFELVLVGMSFAILLGVPLGVASALGKDRWPDHLSRLFAFAGVSLPRFWIGIMFQLAFAYSLGWLPLLGRIAGEPPTHITGFYLLDSLLTANGSAFWDSFRHILLPAVALALSPMAQIIRITRASMIDEQWKDYTTVSRVLGMPRGLLVYKYMLKNAFTSTLTVIGLLFGFFLAGAFVVETVFAWPGMARYGVQAVLFKDFNAVVSVTLIIGLAYVVVNAIVDVLYGYLDPRIRLGRG
ncbi:MAG: ABC transporter permease [Candidatus Methylomirabilales bacterium]